MTMKIQPQCSGDVTFNTLYSSAFFEWPEHIVGIICKTPPVGRGHASRFAECCSGKVYNVTSPTSPDDEAYPMSCAMFCQVSREMYARNPQNPYGFDDHFMCLTDGTREASSWEVICETITHSNMVMPTVFPNTPVLSWKTRPWTTDIYGRVNEATEMSSSSHSRMDATSGMSTKDAATFPSTRETSDSATQINTASRSLPVTTRGISPTQPGAAAATTTSNSNATGTIFGNNKYLFGALLVLASYCSA